MLIQELLWLVVGIFKKIIIEKVGVQERKNTVAEFQ